MIASLASAPSANLPADAWVDGFDTNASALKVNPQFVEQVMLAADALADIEISPAGLGLHWPQLDADVYLPALLQGVFGSRTWMAAQLGSAGGQARSPAKAAAARANGRKGGRPPRSANP
mgnify:CR=1 FL=1